MSFFGAKPTLKPAVNESTAQDVEVPNGPTDSISAISFSPSADLLAVSSWDNQIRIYEIGQSINGKAAYSHEAPVLDVCWSRDGTKVLSGGVDNTARLFDLQTGTASQVAQHQAPIRCVRWIDMQNGLLATGSWDKTIKYWDLRTPNPVASVSLEERCYAMDVCGSLLVVGTAERKIQIYNLQNPTAQYGPTIDSPLKFQTRSIACFPDQTGYAVGSIEGRVAIQYIDEVRAKSENFSFKCHRANEPKVGQPKDDSKAQLFAVNAVSFHPIHGTFSTAGSDGTISFWDKTNKTRLKKGKVDQIMPITSTAFNNTNGSMIFAYAVSYDWAHGFKGNSQSHANMIKLHICKDDEIKKRPKA
ncbi:MAG: hypothetical protein CYPHOPRED_001663 [Cyphobasidiales sp. Tagirdzhanova-0007]|nr:MAG: hypothetical protein CYPHOPRED_001663 [Cyphobasidiales sp. Tagirdzhanova-0007]